MLRWLSGRGFGRPVGTIAASASGRCPLPAEENQSLSQSGEGQEEGARSEETVALGWEERLRRAGAGSVFAPLYILASFVKIRYPYIEPRLPVLGVRSLSHWTTREVPRTGI